MVVGLKIKQLREESGVFQKELASELGVSESFISTVESGKKLLKREHLKTISKMFSYPLPELEALWLFDKIQKLME